MVSIVPIPSGKGGVGKTILAANLGVCLDAMNEAFRDASVAGFPAGDQNENGDRQG